MVSLKVKKPDEVVVPEPSAVTFSQDEVLEGFSISSADTFSALALKSAQRYIESYTDRLLVQTSVEFYYTTNLDSFYVYFPPSEITEVKLFNGADSVVLNSTQYSVFYGKKQNAVVSLVDSDHVFDVVKITASCGYTTTPTELKTATLLLAVYIYENRLASIEEAFVRSGAKLLCLPFKKWRV